MMIGRIGTQSTGINAGAINQSVSHKNKEMYGKAQQENKIQAVISPQGKKQNLIQQLMKQKQELTDRMNSLSADGGESGLNIQDQMKQYQKQLESLDEQITQLQIEKDDDKEKEKSETSGIYEKPKTKAEMETEKFESIVNLSVGMDRAETISSVKNAVDGRANVLKAEIKSGFGNIESKMEEVSELENQSLDLASQVAENIHETSGQIENIQDTVSEKEQEDEESNSISALDMQDTQEGE